MAGEFRKAARSTQTVSEKMVGAGGKAAAKPILAAYQRDSGGDLNLSGTRSPWKFKTPIRVRGRGDASAKVRITPAGPASWRNYGTKHTRGVRTFDRAQPQAIDDALVAVRKVFKETYG